MAISVFSGCGSIPTASKGTSSPAVNTNTAQTSGLGAILSGVTGSSTGSNSMIGGVIGQLIGGLVAPPSIEGAWVYSEPTIQFESESLLAKAGGAVATEKIVEKA